MNLKKPVNENYAAVVTTITTTVTLENCDNVHHAIIFGNAVIVGKDVKFGSRGIFFPVETKLSDAFLKANNLYRKPELNEDNTQKGYFEENGRIKCMKFRGHKSEGLFLPLTSLAHFASIEDLAKLKERDALDDVNGVKICEKYVPRYSRTPGQPGSGNTWKKLARKSKLIEGQFRLHEDTAQLGRNIHRIKPSSYISITNKLHGTSFVVGRVLIKKPLTRIQRFLKWLKVPIVDTQYGVVYASRKVIKNEFEEQQANHYYKIDVWAEIAKYLEPYLYEGMTIYGEAVGFTSTGMPIQKGYDYGYSPENDVTGHMGVYIYRITLTNPSGKVFELSATQVQQWCKFHGLNPVPEYFNGRASELLPEVVDGDKTLSTEEWQAKFLDLLKNSFNLEKDCELCTNKVPAEGIAVRIEGLDFDTYKLKSFRFLEHETKELDKGEIDIETEESIEEEN